MVDTTVLLEAEKLICETTEDCEDLSQFPGSY